MLAVANRLKCEVHFATSALTKPSFQPLKILYIQQAYMTTPATGAGAVETMWIAGSIPVSSCLNSLSCLNVTLRMRIQQHVLVISQIRTQYHFVHQLTLEVKWLLGQIQCSEATGYRQIYVVVFRV